jgi:quinol-cytochrome oxidoreductase complex cytochrome b subunit
LSEERQEKKGNIVRLVKWFDSRLGLSYEMLRPAPQYAVNPFYWLGALAVVAFVIQGITGIIMMLYYVPSPAQAYSSTLYIFQNVSYGRFLETVHLYTAYAMIMLAFMHMMRNYFVSTHKRPRELMWVVGMGMGFVTLGFGFTGYLLPWTVISKSASDVGTAMIGALPHPLSDLIRFLVVGSGADAAELLRFYDLHVVVLPAILLVLLAIKMYMLETHGISEPVIGNEISESRKKLIPIFPDMSLYLLELAALFGGGMLLISALIPLNLPAQYTPQLAATTVPQPDWYFLWIYQILKISIFEGPGLPIALSIVTLIFIVLILLPFLDRGQTRRISQRPKFVTIGAIFVGELLLLAYWGLITPGQVIPLEQAALVLGLTALIIALVSLGLYRLIFPRARTVSAPKPTPSLRNAQISSGICFASLSGLGALTIGGTIDASVKLILTGTSLPLIEYLLATSLGLVAVLSVTVFVLYRSDLATGHIKRRVDVLEIGWFNESDK